jgi:hypothetical protein
MRFEDLIEYVKAVPDLDNYRLTIGKGLKSYKNIMPRNCDSRMPPVGEGWKLGDSDEQIKLFQLLYFDNL